MKEFIMNKTIVLIVFCLMVLVACNNDKKTVKNDTNRMSIDSVETIESISQKIRENPLNADLFLERSELHMQELNAREAISDVELAIKIDSLRPDIYTRLSDYNMTIGQSEQAKDILVKAVNKFPLNTEARLKLAYIYFYVDMYDEAMNEIKFLEENNLQEAEVYFLKAMIFDAVEMYDDAIRTLGTAIEYNNNYWEAYNLLGLIYASLDNKLAVEYFITATNLFPDNLEIRYHAGYVFQKFGLIDKAINEYEYIISIDPNHFLSYFNLGDIYVNNLKDNKRSVEYFSKAIEIDPKSYKAYYNRGYVYELMGNYKLAESDYRKSLEIFPNYELAVQGLNEVLEKQ